MIKHAPTPWFVVEEASWRDGLTIATDPEGREAVAITTRGFEDGPSRANAAFIVRACNAHEALVEALKLIRFQWAGHSEACESVLRKAGGKCDCDWPMVSSTCDAALKLAETP